VSATEQYNIFFFFGLSPTSFSDCNKIGWKLLEPKLGVFLSEIFPIFAPEFLETGAFRGIDGFSLLKVSEAVRKERVGRNYKLLKRAVVG